ncbi:MAG: hypothetical protein HY922_15390 [Elusimicrobia bacterium]|nr:hypothetical protein [Elusimicrobiota bacterium]
MKAARLLLLLLALPDAGALAAEMSGSSFTLVETAFAAGAGVSGGSGLLLYSGTFGDAASSGAEGVVSGGEFSLLAGASNSALYLHTVNNLVDAQEGKGSVMVPANAAANDFDFYINIAPKDTPFRIQPPMIQEAQSRLSTLGPYFTLLPQSVLEINMMKDDGTFQDAALAAPATLSISYPDVTGDGIVDGTSPPVRAKTLRLWRLDEQRGMWVKVPDSSVDASSRTVSGRIQVLHVYALIGAADCDVSNVYAFPVPWSPNSGDPSLGNKTDGIRFAQTPTDGSIRIYNIAGELVRSLDIPPGNLGTVSWDVRTNGGHDVASGVYIWVAASGSNKKSGKLMIIR